MKNKLWCDLKTDEERVEFLRSGRAWETGIIAKSIVEDVARAFERPGRPDDESQNINSPFNKPKPGICSAKCSA